MIEYAHKSSEINIENAAGLKKLYLQSLPGVETLSDFAKLPELYALKIYELHKLNGIESLTNSSIKYLSCTLAADKLSGTSIADTLLNMKYLEQAHMNYIDRSSLKRYNVLENKMKTAGKENLLVYEMDYDTW